MKKLIAIFIVVVLTASLFSIHVSAASVLDMSAYEQMTFNVYKTTTPPALNGVVNESTYGAALGTWSPGSYGSYSTFVEEFSDADKQKINIQSLTLYMTYDDAYIYVGVVVHDEFHHTPLEGPDVWDGDYVGFDFNGVNFGPTIDDMNDRLRTAIGISNSGGICTYYATNPPSGYVEHETGVDLGGDFGFAVRDEANKLTIHQIKYPWADLMPEGKPPEKALINLYYGLGHPDFDGPYGGGYVGAFRVVAPVPLAVAQELGSTADSDPQAVYHLFKFAGDPPPVVEVEVVEEFAEAEVAPVAAAVTVAPAAKTGDGAISVFAIMIIAAGAFVVSKRVIKTR